MIFSNVVHSLKCFYCNIQTYLYQVNHRSYTLGFLFNNKENSKHLFLKKIFYLKEINNIEIEIKKP